MIRLEGADLRQFTKLAFAVAGALLVVSSVGACGEESTGDGDAPSWPAIEASLESTGRALDRGDLKAVCDQLGPRAQEQVRRVGHDVAKNCAVGLRMLAPAIRRGRKRAATEDRPAIQSVEPVGRVLVTVKVEGRTVRIPFVQDGRKWRMDSFYGFSPRPSRRFD